MRVRATILSAVVTAIGLLAGCGGGAGGADITGHSRLIDELAQQVDSADGRGYTAEYLLAGGEQVVTVAKQAEPEQVAFLFPGGRYVITKQFAMLCTPAEAVDCVLTPAPRVTVTPGATVLSELDGEQFLSVQTVMGWLTEVGASSSANITSETRSIAGAHSTCVSVSGAGTARVSEFEACVTDSGLLGSFTGTVDGEPKSVVLKAVSGTVDPEAFVVPEGASILDERSKSPT